MRAALIRDGIVENLIIFGEGYTPDEGFSVVQIDDEPVEIGAAYDGKIFINPEAAPEPVPESVTPLQMRKALRQLGLKPTVDAFLERLDEETVEAWEYATSIERNNPFVSMATGGLGMTDEQADDLFRLAASL